MRIRDPGWKKFGSRITIPDPHHCFLSYYLLINQTIERKSRYKKTVSKSSGSEPLLEVKIFANPWRSGSGFVLLMRIRADPERPENQAKRKFRKSMLVKDRFLNKKLEK